MTNKQKAYKKVSEILNQMYSIESAKNMNWITILGTLLLTWGIKQESKRQTLF
jgi:hypothetical protein